MRFDMHVHTHASIDGAMTLDKAIAAAKRAGLSGIAVTDHNVFTPPPETRDFIVIPGCEYTTDAGHILTYFINSPLHEGLSRDALGRYHWRDIIDRAHAQGALAILAHPYSPELPRDEEVFSALDGIEGYNARIEHSRVKAANPRAQAKIRELGCAFTAGSDAHTPREVGAAFWEYIPEKGDADEIKHALKNRDGMIYGGTAKPIWRVYTAWLKNLRRRSLRPKTLCSLTARTLCALIKCARRNRVPERIHINGKDG